MNFLPCGAKICDQLNNIHVLTFEKTCTNIWNPFKENVHSASAQNPQGKCGITCLCRVCFTIWLFTELLQNVLQFKVKIQKSNGIEIFRWLPFLGFTYFSIIDGFHIFHVSYCKSCWYCTCKYRKYDESSQHPNNWEESTRDSARCFITVSIN